MALDHFYARFLDERIKMNEDLIWGGGISKNDVVMIGEEALQLRNNLNDEEKHGFFHEIDISTGQLDKSKVQVVNGPENMV